MVSVSEGTMDPLGDMDLDEFRRGGYRIVDWIADYRVHPERYPVLSRSRPGEILAHMGQLVFRSHDARSPFTGEFSRPSCVSRSFVRS
jgi:hypothetical protein